MAEKYNVLLMRDDSNVKRFRLGSFWLKLFVYCVLLLLVLSAGGVWGTYTFWTKNTQVVQERNTLREKLLQTQLKLERLQNMEKIYKANENQDLKSLIDNMASVETTPDKDVPPVDLSKVLADVDLGRIKVDDVGVKSMGASSMRITFNINNVDTEKALGGNIELEVVTKDAQSLDVDGNKTDLSFLIQRFKRIVTTFEIPEAMQVEELFAVRLVVMDSDGTIIFSEAYPLEAVLS